MAGFGAMFFVALVLFVIVVITINSSILGFLNLISYSSCEMIDFLFREFVLCCHVSIY